MNDWTNWWITCKIEDVVQRKESRQKGGWERCKRRRDQRRPPLNPISAGWGDGRHYNISVLIYTHSNSTFIHSLFLFSLYIYSIAPSELMTTDDWMDEPYGSFLFSYSTRTKNLLIFHWCYMKREKSCYSYMMGLGETHLYYSDIFYVSVLSRSLNLICLGNRGRSCRCKYSEISVQKSCSSYKIALQLT